jgi:hypothetical protein
MVVCTQRKYRKAASLPFLISFEWVFVVIFGYATSEDAKARYAGGERNPM